MHSTLAIPCQTSQADRYKVMAAGIAALILTVGIARFAYTPMLPLMTREAGLSRFAGGMLATLNYVGYLAGLLLVTSMRQAQQRYLLYRASLVAAVLTTMALAWTQDVYVWGALRVVAGVTSVAGMILAAGLVFDWLRAHGHNPVLGLHFSGLGLGIALSGIAAIVMQGRLHWDGQWLVLGLVGMLFLIPAWLWIPRPIAAPARQQVATPAPSRCWLTAVTFAYFCAGFGYVISATFIVAILEATPQFAGKGAWIWVLVGIAAIPASLLWDRVAHTTGVARALLLVYAVQVVAIVIPAATDASLPNLIAAFLFGITVTAIVSLMLSLVSRRYPANASAAMARLTASYGISQIAAPAIAGALATLTGGYRVSLWMAAGMMLLGMVALWMLPEE